MCSRDPTVRYIATRKTVAKETSIRAAFKEVIDVLKDDSGASNRQIIRRVKDRVMAANNSRRLEDYRQLEVQGDISRWFEDQDPPSGHRYCRSSGEGDEICP